MKKTLLIFLTLALLAGASSAAAANTYWYGSYSCVDEGTWKGTIYDSPVGPRPYFKGEWASADMNKHGTMYASLKADGYGNYTIVKGILYNEKGNEVGVWNGTFTLMVKPGHGEGGWAWLNAPYKGHWTGQLIITEDE